MGLILVLRAESRRTFNPWLGRVRHYVFLLNEVHLSLLIVCSQICGFARCDERHWLLISRHACAYAFYDGLRSDSAFAQSNKRN